MKTLALLLIATGLNVADAAAVEFSRDIRPLLNKQCTICHGGVKRAGGVSFLGRDLAMTPEKSGAIPVRPGHPGVTGSDGCWKLQLPHTYPTLNGRPGGINGIPAKYELRKIEATELYDLQNDVSETKNVAAANPKVVKQLKAFAEKMRAELGDSLTQRTGRGVRQPGRWVEVW